ncbi:MAG: hypothetical protein Q8P50_02455 [Bacillota bacterium]|nr:hypothetical protein [Bacillota bacterium]
MAWAIGSALHVFLQVGRVKHDGYVTGIGIVHHPTNVRSEQEPLLLIGSLGKELLEIPKELERLARVNCEGNRLLLSRLVEPIHQVLTLVLELGESFLAEIAVESFVECLEGAIYLSPDFRNLSLNLVDAPIMFGSLARNTRVEFTNHALYCGWVSE